MDTSLKQRLVGAVVLVALAVIFLPMLIKGPAPDSGVSDVPLEVPAAPNGEYETRELPLVTPGNTPAQGVVGMPDAAGNTASVPVAATATNMQPASSAAGSYAVSFGAYATAKDADAVVSGLTRAQLPGYREAAVVNGRNAYRVRVGPYPDRASAESARLSAVKIRNDVNAQVVVLDATTPTATAASNAIPTAVSVAQPAASTATVTTETLPPEPAKPPVASQTAPANAEPPKPATTAATPPPKPATAAAKPAATVAAASVGFAVQLGAFSSAADANALRDKVRAGGFSAFVEQVRTDKGTLSRVRVGPVANRAAAETLRAQVAAKFGVNGMVRPHP